MIDCRIRNNPGIEIAVLPRYSPAIERTEPGEVVTLVGGVLHAVNEKRRASPSVRSLHSNDARRMEPSQS